MPLLASEAAHAQSMFGAWEQKFLPEARLCVAQVRATNQPMVSWAEVAGRGGSLAYVLSVPDAPAYRPGQRVPASLDGHGFSLVVARVVGPHVTLALPGKAATDAWDNIGAKSHEMRVGPYAFPLAGQLTAETRNVNCEQARLEGVVR